MPYDFRFGLPDELIPVLRRFGEATGRRPWIAASQFLEMVGDAYPRCPTSQTMEFLWASAPLRHRHHPEPMDGIREEIDAFLEFTEQQFNVDLAGSRRVAADRERFADRWMTLQATPLPVWLEDLRMEMAVLGLPSSIPAADPKDPHFTRLAAQLIPGPQGLAIWRPAEPAASAPDVETLADCDALNHIAALLEVVGAGTRLTPKGNLRLADGKALAEATGFGFLFDESIGSRQFKTKSTAEVMPLELLVHWARAAGLVRVMHGKLLPTARAKAFGTEPLADWWLLFRATVLKCRWASRTSPGDSFWFWSKDIDEFMPAYLRIAAQAAERGLALLIAAEASWLVIEERWMVDPDPSRFYYLLSGIAHHILLQLFVPLEMLGAATSWEGGADRCVRLTDAGQWAARRLAPELAADPRYGVTDDVIELFRHLDSRPER